MHLLRTRFKKDIVCEFLPSARKSRKVLILCGGMPSVPAKKDIMAFWAKKNYWVFNPRYRGTWESGGEFLKQSPEQDILDILDELPGGFKSLWDNASYKLESPEIFLMGFSFGGPAAILASRDSRVKKSVACCPVVDWTAPSEDEPMDWLEGYVRQAFGEAYRFSHKNWKRLSEGKFYNPATHIREIDGRKLFVIHTKDDASVRYQDVKKFSRQTGAKFWLLPKGGHCGFDVTKPKFFKAIRKFFTE